MKAKVTTLDNKAIGDIELAAEVFGIKPRRDNDGSAAAPSFVSTRIGRP